MKNLVLLFIFSLILFSCKKDNENDYMDFLIPENEVPEWMKTKIEQKKQTKLLIVVWVRYDWQNESYFEEIDMNSSYSFAIPVSFNGDSLLTKSQDGGFNSDAFKRYNEEKCCRTDVWKSPTYREIMGINHD